METINQGTFAYDLFEYVNMPVAKSGEKGDIEYEVTVKTGDVMFAGTDADIFITVVGDKGATKCQPLNHLWRNDFERGNKGTFHLRFSGIRPLRGGGVPPFAAKEKNLLFFRLKFR